MSNKKENCQYILFNGNPVDVKVKCNLLMLTLWEIREKSRSISYCLESIRELGVEFEQYDENYRLQFCAGNPVVMAEHDLEEFYINISMIRDHYQLVMKCLEKLEFMGVRQDYFKEYHRRKYEHVGLPDEIAEDADPDDTDDPRQGSLF